MKLLTTSFFVFLLGTSAAFAEGIYKQSVQSEYEQTYKKLYKSLEDSRFFVVQEINMTKNLSGFAKRWGDDYNRNKLDNIRVMIICNGWYANQVSNLDTDMLALCPMRVTLISKGDVTTALFAKPSTFAKDSKALSILKEVDETIIKAIQAALK